MLHEVAHRDHGLFAVQERVDARSESVTSNQLSPPDSCGRALS
jgi:hypothetical protein